MRLFISVLFLGLCSYAAPSARCIYEAEKKINMPPQRDQGATGFCYGFAATALLQNHYCTAAPKTECHFEDDSLSVLDVMAQGNYGNGGLIHRGYPFEMLESISRSKSVSLESCAPFSPFLESNDNIWKSTVSTAKIKYDLCRDKTIADQLKTQLKLRASSQEILFALGYSDYSIMMSKIFIPKECENKKIKIPAYTIKKSSIKEFSHYKEKLIELLNQDKPIIASICSFTSTRQNMDCSKSLHSLVVSGYRKKCCAGVCETQFQMYDSARPNTFKKNEITTDDWVSEVVFKNRVEAYNRMNRGDNLLWIESK